MDLRSKWAGIRPLVKEGDGNDTKSVARKHVIEESESGLISLMGGKWTAYRKMAEDTTDLVMKRLNEEHEYNYVDSQTLDMKLVGEFTKQFDYVFPTRESYLQVYSKSLVDNYKFDQETANYLIENYGDRAYDIAKICEKDKSLKQKLSPKHNYILAEIIYQTKHEFATNPIDILFRRLRLGFLDSQEASNCL